MNKKVALITGASAGIGRDLAQIHAERGGDLVLVARRKMLLDEMKEDFAEKYGTQSLVIQLDLEKPNAAEIVYEAVKKEGIVVDHLINNAGFGGVAPFAEQDWFEIASMIQLNIVHLTQLTHLFLPDMIARDNGNILNLGSIAGIVPGPMQAVYYATKAYVNSFGCALAGELADTGITVTTVMPGPVATEFAEVSRMKGLELFDNPADSRKVAEAAYEAMIRGEVRKLLGVSKAEAAMMKMVPLVPVKILLNQIRRRQTHHQNE